ncbi:unnamed protein product [Streptococcus anginosus]|nr:unnamed protein product [Streptococcus anginosus]
MHLYNDKAGTVEEYSSFNRSYSFILNFIMLILDRREN